MCDKCGGLFDGAYAHALLSDCNGKTVQEFDVCRECINEGITLRTKQPPALPPGGPNGQLVKN